ncbi:MAG: aspartate/glutamate racemase family protein [Gaiellales bacterium]
MKIWFQKHTILGRNPWLDKAYDVHMRAILPAGTAVDFAGLPEGVYAGALPADYVKYGQVETFFSWFFADQAVEAERQGYDAYVIGTSQDPGLDMARSLVSIPVVGYGQSVFGLLHDQGLRFGVVGFIPELEEVIRRNLTSYGFSSRCAGFEYLADGRQTVEKALRDGDAGDLVAVMEAAARRLRDRGAQVIVPGEGLPNEVLWASGVRDLAGLPFADANGLSVLAAELLARTRSLGLWAPGSDGYATRRVPASEVDRLRAIFSPHTRVAHGQQQDGRLSS